VRNKWHVCATKPYMVAVGQVWRSLSMLPCKNSRKLQVRTQESCSPEQL
jgi:hypothetical protein